MKKIKHKAPKSPEIEPASGLRFTIKDQIEDVLRRQGKVQVACGQCGWGGWQMAGSTRCSLCLAVLK